MHRRKGKRNKKAIGLLASLAALLVVTVVGTIAFLTAKTTEVKNNFTPAEVPNEVIEDFKDNVKNNVRIENIGNVNSYIRAAVVVTWVEVDDKGKLTGKVYGSAPVLDVDYEWDMPLNNGWSKGADGYYYYSSPVAPDKTTEVLFTDCKPILVEGTEKTKNQPNGYVLSVEIMGQSIQAAGVDKDGKHPVELVWPVVTVNTDGTLTVRSK